MSDEDPAVAVHLRKQRDEAYATGFEEGRDYWRADLDEARADCARLRERIHEAVDECQRRHAQYVSRCAQFDLRKVWARDTFEREGDTTWTRGSEYNRLVILGLMEERDEARAQAVKATTDADDLRARVEAVVATWPPGPRKGDVLRALEER